MTERYIILLVTSGLLIKAQILGYDDSKGFLIAKLLM